MSSEKRKVLMICLGNICRSPIAEAVFADYITKNNLEDSWDVDSAALIGYHTGKSPDRRAMSTLKDKGITSYSHRARPITQEDFDKYDWIFGMDKNNISELNGMKPEGSKAKIELLGSYDPKGETIIRDPYYDSDSAGFVKAYEQCVRSVEAFIEKKKLRKVQGSRMSDKKGVLMVCLGNTCRSPMAEAIFINYITQMNITNNWYVDSAALRNYHVNNLPDVRAMMTLKFNGITNYSHRARTITTNDFQQFHWILGMDEFNINELNEIMPNSSRATIELLGKYDSNGEIIIRDPFCDQDCSGFFKAYEQCSRSVKGFLESH